jgi:hypothetical protein
MLVIYLYFVLLCFCVGNREVISKVSKKQVKPELDELYLTNETRKQIGVLIFIYSYLFIHLLYLIVLHLFYFILFYLFYFMLFILLASNFAMWFV